MPTVKKTFKAVLDALKEAEKQARLVVEDERHGGYSPLRPFDHAAGKLEGLRLARRLVERLIQ